MSCSEPGLEPEQSKYQAVEAIGNQLTISGKEGDGSALGAGTASTTDTVDVILRVVGVVVVQHVGDVANVFSGGNRLACKSRGV